VETLDVLPFTAGFNYNLGLDPAAQTAISSDGRYVVIASKNFTMFKLYDLSTCAVAPDSITGPVNCQLRDLWPFMQSQLLSFIGVFNIRFASDDSLELYT